MTVPSSKSAAVIFGLMSSAVLLAPHPYLKVHAAELTTKSKARLAADLTKQARQFLAEAADQPKSKILKANLAKLRLALNRQRPVLLSATPLLGLLETKETKLEISNEIVGSLPNSEAPTKAPKLMERFRQKLAGLASGVRKTPLTILHVGRVESGSSLFEKSLRSNLQRQYGNAGPGMIAPTRNVLSSDSLSFELSRAGRWRLDSNQIRHKVGFGLSGMRATSRSSLSSMTVTSKTEPFDWVGVTIATGPSRGTFSMQVGDVEKQFDAHAEEPGSRFFKMAVQGKSATVKPGGGAQTTILNWSMGRDRAGIRHVHFDLLNDNPEESKRLDANLIANDLRTLAPDLILLDRPSLNGELEQAIQDLIAQMTASAPQADLVYLGNHAGLVSHLQQSCLNGSSTEVVKPETAIADEFKNASAWTWSPRRADICAITGQLQQGLVDADAANLTSDYAERQAAALAKWLAKPSAKAGDLVLMRPAK